jgi:DNA-binding MarR family transcriptional regulator
LSLAPSTGTELVNRMISLDYIRKSHQGRDQRQILLSVAPKGMELLQHRRQALSEMFAKFLNPFIEEDRKCFVDSFEKIYGFIQKYHL